MLTLHPANRHSARAPWVSVVTGSSSGLNGQSSSSESARSTTTPGWRHWVREMVMGETWVLVCFACVCVCVIQVGWVAFMCITLLVPILPENNLKNMRAMTCVYSRSWCQECHFCQLQLSVEWKIVQNQHYHSALPWCIHDFECNVVDSPTSASFMNSPIFVTLVKNLL